VLLFPDRYYKRSLKQGIGAPIPSLFPIPHSNNPPPLPSPHYSNQLADHVTAELGWVPSEVYPVSKA
jgi:hypothetical protein